MAKLGILLWGGEQLQNTPHSHWEQTIYRECREPTHVRVFLFVEMSFNMDIPMPTTCGLFIENTATVPIKNIFK